MVCQKVHHQGRIKVMVNIQSLIHPNVFSQKSKDVGRGFVYLPSLLSFLVCVFFGIPFLHLFLFIMIFFLVFAIFFLIIF